MCLDVHIKRFQVGYKGLVVVVVGGGTPEEQPTGRVALGARPLTRRPPRDMSPWRVLGPQRHPGGSGRLRAALEAMTTWK